MFESGKQRGPGVAAGRSQGQPVARGPEGGQLVGRELPSALERPSALGLPLALERPSALELPLALERPCLGVSRVHVWVHGFLRLQVYVLFFFGYLFVPGF